MEIKNKFQTVKHLLIFSLILISTFTACTSSKVVSNETASPSPALEDSSPSSSNQITLLFAGDIMAHSVNYNVKSYSKIWDAIREEVQSCDFALANIEAPIDTTKSTSSYPNFNMSKAYVKAAVDAGFNVFSLCNNHTNDQLLSGIKETKKTTDALTKEAAEEGKALYFSGLKEKKEDSFSWNYIEKDGWKIIFLPVTELLNRPDSSDYINYVKTDEASRKKLKDFITKLDSEYPNDLFILSLHTAEAEYIRKVSSEQEAFYKSLLECGVDVLWANHTHLIKDRKYIFNTKDKSRKLIMYANGNTISGQRTKPDFTSKKPNGERDNTGDGLMVKVTFEKSENGKKAVITSAQNLFITTYINTANEYLIKVMDQDFIDYLYDIPRLDWAEYIKRRIKINSEETKDLIEWQ